MHSEELELHRELVGALPEVMRLDAEASRLEHDESAFPLLVYVDSDAGPLIELEEGYWLVRAQGPRILHPLGLPALVVLSGELVEGLRPLKGLEAIGHEDQATAHRVGSCP